MSKSTTKKKSMVRPVLATVEKVRNKTLKKVESMISKKKSKKNGRKSGHQVILNDVGAVGVAASTVLDSRIQFSAARPLRGMSHGLRAKFCTAALDVKVKGSATNNADALWGISSTTDPLVSPLSLDPSVSSRWISPVPQLLSGIFDRFRVNSAKIRYRNTGTPTSTSAPMVFGYTDDYNHPVFTTKTVAAFKSLEHHRVFNAWENWDLNIPLMGDLQYSYDVGSPAKADYRLQDAGAFGLLIDFTNGGSITSYGTLYIEWDIEMYEMSPIYTTVSATFMENEKGEHIFFPGRRVKKDYSNLERFSNKPPGICPALPPSESKNSDSDFDIVDHRILARPLNGPSTDRTR